MGQVFIPKGKKVIIHRHVGGDSYNILDGYNVPLVLSEPLTLSLSSSFEPFLQVGNKPLLNEIGKVWRDKNLPGGGFSTQFAELGYQSWVSTDPLSLNITVTLHVDKTNVDAESQVYIPATRLAQIPLPATGAELNSSKLEGVNNALKIVGLENLSITNLVPPGPSVISVLQGEDDSSGQMYAIRIGRLLNLFPAIIRRAEPTYSHETDSNGYPIWAQVNLDIQSVAIATQEMIKNAGRTGGF
jgi:hypothetical protein